jgi:hypothetical protein
MVPHKTRTITIARKEQPLNLKHPTNVISRVLKHKLMIQEKTGKTSQNFKLSQPTPALCAQKPHWI